MPVPLSSHLLFYWLNHLVLELDDLHIGHHGPILPVEDIECLGNVPEPGNGDQPPLLNVGVLGLRGDHAVHRHLGLPLLDTQQGNLKPVYQWCQTKVRDVINRNGVNIVLYMLQFTQFIKGPPTIIIHLSWDTTNGRQHLNSKMLWQCKIWFYNLSSHFLHALCTAHMLQCHLLNLN